MSTSTSRTALAVLASLSLCHLLNDMLQALLPAIYPMLKSDFGLGFWQIGLITLTNQLTASILQPVVGLYTDRHPEAVLPRGRHGLHACRPAAARRRRTLRHRPGCGGARRRRIGGVPSRVVPHCQPGLRRPPWIRAVAVPDRRQRGLVARTAARGIHRAAAGPARGRVVLDCCAHGDCGALARRCLVRPPVARCRRDGDVGRYAHAADAEAGRPACTGRAAGAHVLQVHLSGQPDELLHVLPDPSVRRLGAERPAPSVRVSRRRRHRHVRRRPGGRSLRTQIRDLGIDPGRAAVQPGAAIREPVLDRRAERGDRVDPRLRVLGDSRLRAGAPAWPRRPGRRALLRVCVRYRRDWRGGARQGLPISPASTSSIGHVRFSRRWGCSRCSLPDLRASAPVSAPPKDARINA